MQVVEGIDRQGKALLSTLCGEDGDVESKQDELTQLMAPNPWVFEVPQVLYLLRSGQTYLMRRLLMAIKKGKGKMPKLTTGGQNGTKQLGKSTNTTGALHKGDNPYGSAAGNPGPHR